MIWISLRYLLFKKMQTTLILLGIILGTTAYVAISGMMLGFQTHILDRLINNNPHITIKAKDQAIEQKELEYNYYHDYSHIFWAKAPKGIRSSINITNPKMWFDVFQSHPDVLAYAPQTTANVLIRKGNIEHSGMITGVIPDKQMRISNIEKYMLSGSFNDIGKGGQRIVLAKGLLDSLGTDVGETIQITSSQGISIPFKIVGSFELGIKDLDKKMIFARLADVQNLKNKPNLITEIGIKLIDPNLAPGIASEFKKLANDEVESWHEVNEGILSVFTTQNIIRNFMTISIIIVAAFGIYNILSILVAQKRKDIAILRAMGYQAKNINAIFLNQGIILGVIGGLIGIVLGFVISYYLSQIEVTEARMAGNDGKMLISFDKFIYIRAFFLSLFASLFSSFFPARYASKLTPIEIIRSGE